VAENNQNNKKEITIPEFYPASYVQSLLAVIEEQNRIIADLEKRIRELEAQLKQNSRNSNRPPSTDIYKRPQSQRKKGERSAGGQKGHEGRTLDWVKIPDQVKVHSISECEGCGASLEVTESVKIERRQVHDIQPLTITVTEHHVEHKLCPHCGRCNHAEFPSDVQYPIQYGRNLKALMVYLCIYQLLPYDRVRETFADLFGRSMSKATLVKAVSECSRNLDGVEEKIRELLAGAQVLHVDETGMRVNGIRQWLHVASTEILTWYGHHRKRGSQATDSIQILPRFEGTMVHDFWASYFRYPCRHALCNVHLLRELNGISENYSQEWSEQMHDLIQEIKVVVDGMQEHSCVISRQQITDFEGRYRQIIEMGMQENPVPEPSGTIVKRGRKKQSKAKNLLDRCRKYERGILLFMHNSSVPFSNNQAERDIRMMKLQQKISGTFRSQEGADWFCRVRGYISTLKKNQMPVLASLVEAFEGKPFIPSAAHRSG
jgi:transposase